MNLLGIECSDIHAVHEIVLDARNRRHTRAVEVVVTIRLEAQHLADAEIVDESHTHAVKHCEQLFRVDCITTERTRVQMRIDDRCIRLAVAIEAVTGGSARNEIGQRVIRRG